MRSIVAAGLTASLAALCVLSQPARAQDYRVLVKSSMDKFRPDQSLGEKGDAFISLHAARGEAESAQILVDATRPLEAVQVGIEPLRDSKGHSITPEVRLTGYVPVTAPMEMGYGVAGDYPDPLLPLTTFDVAAKRNQSLWVTCWVSRQAQPGTYRGNISIRPKGKAALQVPITLRVYKPVLPIASALSSNFMSWGYANQDEYYGAEWEKLQPALREEMLRYRMMSGGLSAIPALIDKALAKDEQGKRKLDWTEFDTLIESWMDKGTTFFTTTYPFDFLNKSVDGLLSIDFDPNPTVEAAVAKRNDQVERLRLFYQHLKEMGWEKNFALYCFDEPTISDGYPKWGDKLGSLNQGIMRAWADMMHENAPGLRSMFVTCDPAYTKVNQDFPAWVQCQHINHFQPEFQVERQKLGEPNWMYVCITTMFVPKYPDIWRIDRTGASHRAIGWWLWKYKADGFLYWNVNGWVTDPYKNAKGINGDGWLFYPDPAKKAVPFPALRAAIVRDAIEDYDLLVLLRGVIDKAPNSESSTAARQMLDANDIVPATNEYSTESAVYETRHRKLLEALDSLSPK